MHTKHSTPWQLFIFLLLVITSLLVSDWFNWSDGARGWLERAMLTIRFQKSPDVSDELKKLQNQLTAVRADLDVVKKENETLRKELESPLPPSLRFIPAYVVSRSFETADKTLLIRAGSREGVREGMPVLVETMLIGKIITVTPHVATVRLLTSNESKITVKLEGGAGGLLVGINDEKSEGASMVDKILQAEQVTEGEQVFTAGDEFMPPNLLIGKVTNVASEPRDPFQQARIDLTVKPLAITSVFVVEED